MTLSGRVGWCLLAISTLLATSHGQDGPSNVPSTRNFLRRSGSRATVIENYIYFDGGELSEIGFNVTGRRTNSVNATLSIDLSTSWSPSDVKIKEVQKPSDVKVMNRQAMLADPSSETFYIWGGASYGGATPPDPVLWKFKTDGRGGGGWSEETDMKNKAFFEQLDRTQGAASVSTPSKGFVFGGSSDKSTSAQPKDRVTGYVVFDFQSKEWSRESRVPYSDSGTLFGASATYVTGFGPNGLVVLLGGTFNGATEYVDFRTVHFLDPVTMQWYSQETSGDAPSDRAIHCATGVAGNNGTYEIFVYGGEIRGSGSSYNDMYVLSLPGFRWTRVVPDRSPPSRRDHACSTVGRRQMLSWGGLDTDAGGAGSLWNNKDTFPQGIGIFDMTELQWRDRYDADAEAYKTHDDIQSWYDDGGMSTIRWSSTETEALFAAQESTPPGDGNDQGGPVPTRVIIGAVVGGVGGVILVAGLVWFLLRRRTRRNVSAMPQTAGLQESYSPPKLYDGHASYTPVTQSSELQGDSSRVEMGGYYGGGGTKVQTMSSPPASEMADTSISRP